MFEDNNIVRAIFLSSNGVGIPFPPNGDGIPFPPNGVGKEEKFHSQTHSGQRKPRFGASSTVNKAYHKCQEKQNGRNGLGGGGGTTHSYICSDDPAVITQRQ